MPGFLNAHGKKDGRTHGTKASFVELYLLVAPFFVLWFWGFFFPLFPWTPFSWQPLADQGYLQMDSIWVSRSPFLSPVRRRWIASRPGSLRRYVRGTERRGCSRAGFIFVVLWFGVYVRFYFFWEDSRSFEIRMRTLCTGLRFVRCWSCTASFRILGESRVGVLRRAQGSRLFRGFFPRAFLSLLFC